MVSRCPFRGPPERRAHLDHIVLLPVRRVELGKIVRDAFLDVFDAPQDRTGR